MSTAPEKPLCIVVRFALVRPLAHHIQIVLLLRVCVISAWHLYLVRSCAVPGLGHLCITIASSVSIVSGLADHSTWPATTCPGPVPSVKVEPFGGVTRTCTATFAPACRCTRRR